MKSLLPLLLLGCAFAARPEAFLAFGGEGGYHGFFDANGIGYFSLKGKLPKERGTWHAFFNTETLEGAVQLKKGWAEYHLSLRGEAFYAGMVPRYYKDTERVRSREFSGHYVLARNAVKLSPGFDMYLEYGFAARYWLFSDGPGTGDFFELPPFHLVLEGDFHYTIWKLRNDPSLVNPLRSFPRVHGWALGLTAAHFHRFSYRSWGHSQDVRNDEQPHQYVLRQYLRAGYEGRRMTANLLQAAGYGWHENDLTRDRAGGLNPFVRSLAGHSWASFLVGRYLSLHPRIAAVLPKEWRLGLGGDWLLGEDLRRSGSSVWRSTFGTMIYFEGFAKKVHLEGALGWAPPLSWYDEKLHLSVYLMMSTKLQRKRKNT